MPTPARPRAGSRGLRRWSAVHRWSSLPPTLLLFILCLTGLPLIFESEISAMLGEAPARVGASPGTLDAMMQAARALHPDRVVQFIVWEADAPEAITFSLAPSITAYPDHNINVVLSRQTGQVMPPDAGAGPMEMVRRLHTQLFLGPVGGIVLGLIALAFVASVLSGIVLYAPFMGQRAYASIRQSAGPRRRHLDWHNFLGITLAIWLLVVGATGWINGWGSLIFEQWRGQVMEPVTAQTRIPPPRTGPAAVLEAAQRSLPGTEPAFIALPGSMMADARHYGVYLRGMDGLRKRQMRLVIVDAASGQVSAIPPIPWYISMLMMAQPLHFGDYGGLGLKLLWALLDLLAIHVLWTGLRLWWGKRGRP
ncbi:PepSY-associated TM helix domain-containing protein [Novosphingobium terrae]|uniref:PepSY-associated TM helix domain-containing protein n=1 Tax=Novosphingobium terrae TaxID=2726189 RepID=UPI001F12A9FB|nr:PepSY-associated TM helix domain-containing protein [Novosphingobium terrae]